MGARRSTRERARELRELRVETPAGTKALPDSMGEAEEEEEEEGEEGVGAPACDLRIAGWGTGVAKESINFCREGDAGLDSIFDSS